MKYFLIFFFLKFALSHYYSIWEQTIFVDKNDYIILNQSDFNNFLSDQIVQSSGQLNITLVSIKKILWQFLSTGNLLCFIRNLMNLLKNRL